MSSPISSCTGPSWIASATRRRTSPSPCRVRLVSSRARTREADSVRAQPADQPGARQRHRREERLVEDQQVTGYGPVVRDRPGSDEQGHAAAGDRQAAPLALEMRVHGHQEQRGEPVQGVDLRHDQLNDGQHQEVARRDQRVLRRLGVAEGEQEDPDRPGQRQAGEQRHELALERKPEHHAERQGDEHEPDAGDREQDDRAAGLDRQPPEVRSHWHNLVPRARDNHEITVCRERR